MKRALFLGDANRMPHCTNHVAVFEQISRTMNANDLHRYSLIS
jgi:hypothetical protein